MAAADGGSVMSLPGTSPGKRLRALIARPGTLVMPGAHDALSARLIEAHGFEAAFGGGSAATSTLLGEADSGQLSMRDYADHYGRLATAVGIPMLMDADTGFGGVHNVRHAVRAFEAAGAAGLFIEDQVFPKRCGYFAGKAVVGIEDMLAKLKAALDARRDPDFIICGRTDIYGLEGEAAAIERAQRFLSVGVDMTFVQGADTVESLARICQAIPCPQLANVSQASSAAPLSVSEIEQAGAAAVIFPVATMRAAVQAVDGVLAALRRDGSLMAVQDRLMPSAAFNTLCGFEAQQAREDGYIRAAEAIAGR